MKPGPNTRTRARTHTHTHTHTQRITQLGRSVLRTSVCLHFRNISVSTSSQISAGERPQAARLLRSWVRIPLGAWKFVCCECRVLSRRDLCDELITRPEESYRLWCVVVCDLETSRMGAPYIHDISRLRVKRLLVKVPRAKFSKETTRK